MKYLMENNKGTCSIDLKNVHFRGQMQACGVDHLSHVASKAELRHKLESYQTILVVRNPYERLYSAYWQKAHLVQRFLAKDKKKKKNNSGSPIPFYKFLEVFVKAMTTSKASYDPIRNNYHWKTISDICSPCIVRYDYIFKLETLRSDGDIFLPIFNAKNLPQLNEAGGSTRRKIPKSSIPDAITAYREIEPVLLEKLTSVLQKDLDLFGYGMDMDSGLYSLM